MKKYNRAIFLVFVIAVFHLEITAQVGVNTDTPEQALDINGKVKVGDDATAPTEGTIRYNSTEKTFEGFNGTSWLKLGEEEIERSFKIKRNTNFTIPSSTNTSIPIDIVEFNNGDCLVEFSSQNFRAPVSGRYQLILSVNICSAATIGGINADISKIVSGGTQEFINRYVFTRTGASSNETFSISTIVDLQQGERITINFGNAGSSTDEIVFCGNSSINAIELSGFLIK